MSLRQVVIVVEGQTEEAFVTQVLGPYLGPEKVQLVPIISHTSRTASSQAHRGGGGWGGYRRKLQTLTAESHWDLVTTMIDFYGYPSDAPGADCHPPNEHRPDACLHERTDAMAADIHGNWLPFLMLHEFETLVIAAGSVMPTVLGDPAVPGIFGNLISAAGEAELVDDHPRSAPAVRVRAVIDDYQKVRDGVAVLQDAPFDEVLRLCPRFAAWVARLAG